MRILYVIGTRPNIVKMAPVIAALRRRLPDARHVVLDTGQHYDRMMSEVFVQELAMPTPDYALGVGSGSHAVQTARVLERVEPILLQQRPDLVIVPGDVNSTLAVVLAAVKLDLPIAHVEAGLRSFDLSMPEEINRIVADRFSRYLFTHSEEARHNLVAEGIDQQRIHFVGNTMIDTLVAMEDRFRRLGTATRLGLDRGNYLLVTLHRPALVDGPMLREVLGELDAIAHELPVVFPVHPRTRRMIGLRPPTSGLRLLEPLGYLDFLSLQSDAAAILTDSGGVQEEATFLHIPCFTLRENTERPITVRLGTNTLLGLDPSRIGDILFSIRHRVRDSRDHPPGWDGQAAERIANVICSDLRPGSHQVNRARARVRGDPRE